MWDKIKQWPTSVKLAGSFLAIMWALGIAAFPLLFAAFTVIGLTIASGIRIVSYFIDGN